MLSTISFIWANLQDSIAASRVFTRTVVLKGIDMALIQEPCYRKGSIMGLNISCYTLLCMSGIDRPRICILARNMKFMDVTRILL